MPIPRLTFHPAGVTAVDTEYLRPGLDAAHIVVQGARAIVVDTGTNASVPLIVATLDELGLLPEAVDYVFLTHVHLDHAGGAGKLLQALPNAQAVLHPRGAPHMVDPTKLIAGSIAVYGAERFAELYGEIVPIAAERIIVTADLQRLTVGERIFEFVHTPGHALHHQAIVDHGANSIFTGDTFGISYREFDTARGAYIMPTTTPTQFDPQQLVASIDRLLAYAPQALYLTHYSRVTDVQRLGEALKAQIAAFVGIARDAEKSFRGEPGVATEPEVTPDEEALQARIRFGLRDYAFATLRAHDCKLPDAEIDALLHGDFQLNSAGLLAWLVRQRR